MIDSKLQIPLLVKHKDGNIGNYEYIGTSILQIYWHIFWHKISMNLKLIKNLKKKCKKKLLKIKLEVE